MPISNPSVITGGQVTPGNAVLHSYDTQQSTNATAYGAAIKIFRVMKGGTYRVQYHKYDFGSGTAYSLVYRNDAAHPDAVEEETTSDTPTLVTQDLILGPGDTVSVRLKSSSASYHSRCSNFRLCGTYVDTVAITE